jgi:hypothetical protein
MQSVHLLIAAAHAGDLDLICRTLVEIVPQYRDHEIAALEAKKPAAKRGLVIPIEKISSDGPSRPASIGYSFKPID